MGSHRWVRFALTAVATGAAVWPAAGTVDPAGLLAGPPRELRIALTGKVDDQPFGPLAATLQLGREKKTGKRTVSITVDADHRLGSLLWLPADAQQLEAREPPYSLVSDGAAFEIRLAGTERYRLAMPTWVLAAPGRSNPLGLPAYSQATGGYLRIEPKTDGIYGRIELEGFSWLSQRPGRYRAAISPLRPGAAISAPPPPAAGAALAAADPSPEHRLAELGDRFFFARQYGLAAEQYEKTLDIYRQHVRGASMKEMQDGYRISQKSLLARLAICHYKSDPRYYRLLQDLLETVDLDRQLQDSGYLANPPQVAGYLPLLERWRDELRSDPEKVAALEDSQQFLEVLLVYFLDQHRFELALEVAEAARGRAYAELLAKRGDRVVSPEPLDFGDMQKLAAGRPGPVIEYFATERFLAIWTLDPSGELAFTTVPVSRAELDGTIGQVQASLEKGELAKSGSPLRAALHRLYRWLLDPLAARLPKDPAAALTIVAHGQLQRLSFAALPFGEAPADWVVFRHALLYLPSLAVLEQLEKRVRPIPELDLAAFLDPEPLPADWAPLPTARELDARLAGLYPLTSRRFTGPAASERQFKKEAGKARLLLLATHAFAESSEPPMPTAILLGRDAENDGYLSPQELEALSLSAELVVLTACQSGRGELKADGVQGLARSFFAAGAKALLATLWEVPIFAQQQTCDFVEDRMCGVGQAEALRRALATLAKVHPVQPNLWAGLALFG